jgi:hypothetical protein
VSRFSLCRPARPSRALFDHVEIAAGGKGATRAGEDQRA